MTKHNFKTGLLAALVAASLSYGVWRTIHPPLPFSQRIAAACRREYIGDGDESVTACQLRQGLRALDESQQRRDREVANAIVGN